MLRPRKDKFTEAEILTALRQNTPMRSHVLAYLYKTYQPMVYEMVRNKRGGDDEAKEVLHEGLIRLERSVRLGQFRGMQN